MQELGAFVPHISIIPRIGAKINRIVAISHGCQVGADLSLRGATATACPESLEGKQPPKLCCASRWKTADGDCLVAQGGGY
jgi:hypothetical protein